MSDATTQLNTDVPLFWQFYLPTTGAPYAPTPAPTGLVYRLNADGTRTALVGAGAALTAIAGLTGAYTYILDDSLNTALGQLIGQATTTDTALTPYPEYATQNYVVEVQKFTFSADKVNSNAASEVLDALAASYDTAGTIGEQINNAGSGGSVPTVQQIVNGVWDELSAAHLSAGTMGLLQSLLASINTRVQAGSITITDGFNARATTLTIKQYQTYSAATNPLQVTVTVPVDPTGADIYLTLLQANVVTAFDGTCLSYNVTTDEATLNFDMTSAESGALEQYDGEFAVSIVDGSNDVFQSIAYPSGILKVKTAPVMPPI